MPMASCDIMGMLQGGWGGSWKFDQFDTFGNKMFFPQFTNISSKINHLHNL